MPLVVPSTADQYLLMELLGSINAWFHLYVNNVTLSLTTQLSDFMEAGFYGYEAQKVSAWVPPWFTTDRSVATADPILWQCRRDGPAETIWGYYVTDGEDGPLIWCEASPFPQTVIQHNGDKVEVFPRATFRQDPSPT